jgi:hypothetical protein
MRIEIMKDWLTREAARRLARKTLDDLSAWTAINLALGAGQLLETQTHAIFDEFLVLTTVDERRAGKARWTAHLRAIGDAYRQYYSAQNAKEQPDFQVAPDQQIRAAGRRPGLHDCHGRSERHRKLDLELPLGWRRHDQRRWRRHDRAGEFLGRPSRSGKQPVDV